jgi:hypothetical protein
VSLALIASSALAGVEGPQRVRGDWGVLYGEAVNSAKAEGDTTYVLGGPDADNGKFEDEFGNPNWFGWTSRDRTEQVGNFWNIAEYGTTVEEVNLDFDAIAGAGSFWCGTVFDGNPGYGNAWIQLLEFSYTVPNPANPSTVNWTFDAIVDTEPDFDFVYFEYNRGGVWQLLQPALTDSTGLIQPSLDVTIGPAEYAGDNNDQIQLRVRMTSDAGWSDEDGLWETDGAVFVDNMVVSVGGSVVSSTNFNDGNPGDWTPVLSDGVGDYAALYSNLGEIDICRDNFSTQVAFVDDGVVVPGTNGTQGTTHQYGPGGWIVNNTGGLLGPDYHIHNVIISPSVPFPDNADAAYLEFTVYRHETLDPNDNAPGIFYTWDIRSTTDPTGADIAEQPWASDNFVRFGGPDFIRSRFIVSDLITPGAEFIQVGLAAYELGYIWGVEGTDGTPAPYFDDVFVVAYPFAGPALSTRDIDIANDNFPELGDIDFGDLNNNWVRFDAAINISPNADENNDPGDSLAVTVVPVRAGTVLDGAPRMYFRMKASTLYDRAAALADPILNELSVTSIDADFDLVTGWVPGLQATNNQGNPVEDRYFFDLPDTGFFYPGDIINYYFWAADDLGGVSTLPGDLDGYDSFDFDQRYDSDFIVRALPSLKSATPGDQPKVLFWNDFGDRGGENEWLFALRNIGYEYGVDYDMYYTSGPSSGVGNGLGGRATSAQLDGYSTMLYTAGDLGTNLLSNGDFIDDAGDDIGLMQNWFNRGDAISPKNAFMTGDNIVSGILGEGAAGQAFVNEYFSVTLTDPNALDSINDQTTPLVRPISGNPVFVRVNEWIAYGGCLGINTFDAIEVNGATRLAEFISPAGQGGQYPFAVGTYFQNATNSARVVTMAHDFMFMYNSPAYTPPAGEQYQGVAARAVLLEDVLDFFGESGQAPIGVTPDAPMTVTNYPNPFNPQTTIKLNLPKTGDVSLKVFNVRGALVRTLVDGQMAAGEHSIIWDGKTDSGSQAASGVYFYETRANGEVKVNKMALVK